MRALWLADSLREFGVNVVEVDGWHTRGSDSFDPKGVVCHHTAGGTTGDVPSLKICIHGRSDLPGPLAHVVLARSGKAYIIASGRANHAGSGGFNGLSGNSSVFGIEAENTGRGEPWSYEQLDAYYRIVAAMLWKMGRGVDWVCAHREWTPRKPDPQGIDMAHFRKCVEMHLVARHIAAGHFAPVNKPTAPVYPTLRLGSTGDYVRVAQAKLGYLPVDGHFGPKTEARVKKVQRLHGLRPDGVIGPATWAVLAKL